MYRKPIFHLSFIIVLSAAAIMLLLPMHNAAGGSTTPALITPLPLGNNGAPGQIVQLNNDYWFTAPGSNAIGQLVITSTNPLDYSFAFYNIPTANSQPYDLAAHSGLIWFTELNANKLGKLDTATGMITEYTIPTANSQPTGIAVASDGTVWLAERAGNQLASFNPTTETFTEYPYSPSQGLPADLAPEDVAVSSAGNVVWFTSPSTTRLVSFNTGTQLYTLVLTATPGSSAYTPSQVVLDSLGNVWISTRNGRIGRYSPSTIQIFAFYPVASETSAIDGLYYRSVSGDNQLWFTESNTGFAGQLTTAANGSPKSSWRFPVVNGSALGIIADSQNNAFIADSTNHNIILWASPYFLNTYLPTILK